jgi:hypothetical protein
MPVEHDEVLSKGKLSWLGILCCTDLQTGTFSTNWRRPFGAANAQPIVDVQTYHLVRVSAATQGPSGYSIVRTKDDKISRVSVSTRLSAEDTMANAALITDVRFSIHT